MYSKNFKLLLIFQFFGQHERSLLDAGQRRRGRSSAPAASAAEGEAAGEEASAADEAVESVSDDGCGEKDAEGRDQTPEEDAGSQARVEQLREYFAKNLANTRYMCIRTL